MNSHEAGRSSIERAALILEEARHLQVKDACNLALRRAHEAAELALWGTLLWLSLFVIDASRRFLKP